MALTMAKVRSDSWAGRLTLDEQAEIYESWIAYKGKWEEFADWITANYENAVRPARTALYNWAGQERLHAGSLGADPQRGQADGRMGGVARGRDDR